jgi:RNA polymerase-interacting CarD/CdnL/TRCF family regulator
MPTSKYQKRFLALIKKVQELYYPAIVQAINKQIEGYMKTGKVPKQPIAKVLRELYKASGSANGLEVHKQLKRQMPKAADDFTERILLLIEEYYRINLLNKAVLFISDTTQKQIEQFLQQADAQGWGAEKTAREIAKTSQITKSRAELIVRTESLKSANAGAMLAAADMDIALDKVWISAQDNRTRRIPRDRYDHLFMHSVKVGFEQKFVVPSTERIEMLDYPGDPTASAGNVCNCRCTVAFEPKKDNTGQIIRGGQYQRTEFHDIADSVRRGEVNQSVINQLVASLDE